MQPSGGAPRQAEQIGTLHGHLDKMEHELGNSSAFTALEVQFHTLVARATNNAVLRIYSTSLAELTYRQIRHVPFTRPEMEMGLSACEAILQSIEQGDGERAEHRTEKHLAAVEADIMHLSRSLGGRPMAMMEGLSPLTEAAGKQEW